MAAPSTNCNLELESLPPLPLLEEALKNVQRLWSLPLSFPPELEDYFERMSRRERVSIFRLMMFISAILFESFLLLDWFCVGDRFTASLVVRVGVCLPVTAVCTYLVRHVRPLLRELLFFLPGLLTGSGVLYLYRGPMELVAQGQLGMTVLMVGTFTMVRPRFRYACFSLPVWGVGNLLYLLDGTTLPTETVASLCSLQWAAMGVSLLANYWMERSERISFLLLQRYSHWNIELADSNSRLAEISILDPLTEIPNRRHFDNEFEKAWKVAELQQQPLSVLMIDLDHFKRINDLYGHSYGDQVLREAARAIREALRCDSDRIARYGGEEFVAVFPACSLRKATSIAERIREAIQNLRFLHGESGAMERITVSIGVACKVPDGQTQACQLLESADEALYAAKNSGRNRVSAAA